MVFELLAESIRESGETPHRPPHREVRTFRLGRGDVLRIGIAGIVSVRVPTHSEGL
jgi:hypothetical protein